MMGKRQIKQKYYLTPEGRKQVKRDYEKLLNLERPSAIEQLRIAREFGGDPEDGNVYASALERLRWVERKIAEATEILENTVLIEKRVPNGEVIIGSTVKVEIGGERDILFIVGSREAQPEEGKISNESPVGKALLGKKVGEVVEVRTPDSRLVYKIIEVF